MPVGKIQGAVILAAGVGAKFWPYNVVRQKAAFPIANVPIIRRLCESLAGIGVTRQVVVVGEHAGSVRAALRGTGAEIVFVHQATPAGTADAALLGAQMLDGDFLIAAGDVVTDPENLSRLLERFNHERPKAAALIQPLGRESPRDWLIAHAEDGRLIGVEGHPRSGSQRLCGLYAWRADAVDALQDNPGIMNRVPVGGMPPVEAELAQSLQILIDEGEDIVAVEATGYLIDVDCPWHILEANQRVIESMSIALAEDRISPSSRVHDGAEIHGKVVLGANATVGNRAVIRGNLWLGAGSSVINGAILDGPVVVGADTRIRDGCLIGGHSTLGARSVYGHGAEFSGVALDTVYCYHYCEIWGVVGEAVDFGAATVCGNLRFDDAETTWRLRGRSQAPSSGANAAYFGDHSRTGVNAIIMPGRRIGAYSCVGPGVVAYDDLPDRQIILLKQELETRTWGPERYGW